MAESSWMMIHEPWTGLVGTAADLRQAANELDMVGDTINRIYSKRTLLESDRVTELMKAETWMTPADAVALGFADSIAEERKIAAHIKHDPTIFPFRRMPEKTPASKPMRNRRVAQMAAQIRKRKH